MVARSSISGFNHSAGAIAYALLLVADLSAGIAVIPVIGHNDALQVVHGDKNGSTNHSSQWVVRRSIR